MKIGEPGQPNILFVMTDQRRSELISLTDLFAITTGAAGKTEVREGIDVLGMLDGSTEPRNNLIGYYGLPGSNAFKIMVRDARWKYIYFANGGKEQLFDFRNDPDELKNLAEQERDIVRKLRTEAVAACRQPGARDALEGDDLKALPFRKWKWNEERVYQFDLSRGVLGFPENPGDLSQ